MRISLGITYTLIVGYQDLAASLWQATVPREDVAGDLELDFFEGDPQFLDEAGKHNHRCEGARRDCVQYLSKSF